MLTHLRDYKKKIKSNKSTEYLAIYVSECDNIFDIATKDSNKDELNKVKFCHINNDEKGQNFGR